MLIHEEKLKVSSFYRIGYLILFILFATIMILFINDKIYETDRTGFIIMGIIFVFSFLVIYGLMPKKYLIFDDCLKIICSLIKITIKFENIEYIKDRKRSALIFSFDAVAFGQLNKQNCLFIRTKKGFNYIIQPEDFNNFKAILMKSYLNFIKN